MSFSSVDQFPLILGLSLRYLDRKTLLALQCVNSSVANVVSPLIWRQIVVSFKKKTFMNSLHEALLHPTYCRCQDGFCNRRYVDMVRILDLSLMYAKISENLLESLAQCLAISWPNLIEFRLYITSEVLTFPLIQLIIPFSQEPSLLQTLKIYLKPSHDPRLSSLASDDRFNMMLTRIFAMQHSSLKNLHVINTLTTSYNCQRMIVSSLRDARLQTLEVIPRNTKSSPLFLKKLFRQHKDTLKTVVITYHRGIFDGMILDHVEKLQVCLMEPADLATHCPNVKSLELMIPSNSLVNTESIASLMHSYVDEISTRFEELVVNTKFFLPVSLPFIVPHRHIKYAKLYKSEESDLINTMFSYAPQLTFLRVSFDFFEFFTDETGKYELDPYGGIQTIEFAASNGVMHHLTPIQYSRYFPQISYSIETLILTSCVVENSFVDWIPTVFPNLRTIVLCFFAHIHTKGIETHTCGSYQSFFRQLARTCPPLKKFEEAVVYQGQKRAGMDCPVVLQGFPQNVRLHVK